MKSNRSVDDEEKRLVSNPEEEPVCPVCKMSSCRGALGYKCEYFGED